MEWLFVLFIGFIIGSVLGLTGVGGGIIFTPMAVHLLGYPREEAMGLALLVICLNTASTAIHSWKKRDISWKSIIPYLCFAPLAALSSAHYAPLLPTNIRLWLFISLLFLAGLSILFSPKSSKENLEHRGSHYIIQALAAILIGTIAGLLGVGAGFLFVPALYYLARLSITKAIASSLVIVSISSASGFIGAYPYLVESQTRWGPTLGIIAASLVLSVLLSPWRTKLPKKKLQLLFCSILWIIAAWEIIEALVI